MFIGFTSRDPVLFTRAYTTFVRPISEYCSVIWSTYLLKDIDAIEGVQRYFTRRIYSHRSFSQHERLLLLGLVPLEVWRLRFDLLMCFKSDHNLVYLDRLSFFNFPGNCRTRGHSLKLVKLFNKNVQFDHFFCNRSLTVGILFLLNLFLVRLYLNLKILLKKLYLDKLFERSCTSDFIIPAPNILQASCVCVLLM